MNYVTVNLQSISFVDRVQVRHNTDLLGMYLMIYWSMNALEHRRIDDVDIKQGIKNCVSTQPGSHKEITWIHTQYITLQHSWHVSSLLTQQSKPRNGSSTPGFQYKDNSVCRLICVAIWRPYSTMNEGEVWALQRTTKPAGLCLSVLTIKLN